MHQYDLISGQPAKKKVKLSTRPALSTSMNNDTNNDNNDNNDKNEGNDHPVIPDPEPKSEGVHLLPFTSPVNCVCLLINEIVGTGGCVCSICQGRASMPFSARCGHICCHECWIQVLSFYLFYPCNLIACDLVCSIAYSL